LRKCTTLRMLIEGAQDIHHTIRAARKPASQAL
jgi:hypothetical protein